MLLDLHVHSVFSLDSPTRPEEYAQAAVELGLEGLVFMEHKRLVTDFDFAALGQKFNLVILHGVEAETFWGHLLLYGATPDLAQAFDLSRRLDPVPLAQALHELGGLAVPAHIFRPGLGLGTRSLDLPGFAAVETLNGGNSLEENRSAAQWAARVGLAAVGGSDAHFRSELGSCLTRLENSVRTMVELVAEIKAGRCQAIARPL